MLRDATSLIRLIPPTRSSSSTPAKCTTQITLSVHLYKLARDQAAVGPNQATPTHTKQAFQIHPQAKGRTNTSSQTEPSRMPNPPSIDNNRQSTLVIVLSSCTRVWPPLMRSSARWKRRSPPWRKPAVLILTLRSNGLWRTGRTYLACSKACIRPACRKNEPLGDFSLNEAIRHPLTTYVGSR